MKTTSTFQPPHNTEAQCPCTVPCKNCETLHILEDWDLCKVICSKQLAVGWFLRKFSSLRTDSSVFISHLTSKADLHAPLYTVWTWGVFSGWYSTVAEYRPVQRTHLNPPAMPYSYLILFSFETLLYCCLSHTFDFHPIPIHILL